jgi:hypothetical protein
MTTPWRRHTLTQVVLALVVAVTVVGCSAGGDDDAGLKFEKLPAPPRALNAATPIVENADTVIAFIDGRLFRYDPWDEHPTWLELARDLPSAKSRIVSWNDRVWYLTTDRGRLEIASVTLSGERRSDTRVVSGATDASFAIVDGGTAVYVFGESGGFRIDLEGIYAEVPAPPRGVITDWSKAIVAELDDGSIAVVFDNQVRMIFTPDIAQWREPSSEVAPKDARSITVTSDGLVLVAGTPAQAYRVTAANHLEPVAAAAAGCDAPALYTSDVGAITVGCGKATLVEGEHTRRIDIPPGTSVVSGPRGRPLAIGAQKGEVWLLQ